MAQRETSSFLIVIVILIVNFASSRCDDYDYDLRHDWPLEDAFQRPFCPRRLRAPFPSPVEAPLRPPVLVCDGLTILP
jgi:hypothetical protein